MNAEHLQILRHSIGLDIHGRGKMYRNHYCDRPDRKELLELLSCLPENKRLMGVRTALRYHGGKFKLAKWIIGHIAKHRVYVEPFCGAANVLLQKPRSYGEVINDLDGEVTNFFRVLRDESEAFQRAVHLTPFSREEYNLSRERTDDPIERARRTLIRSLMGFGSGSTGIDYNSGFRCNSNRSGTTPAHVWSNYPKCVREFSERLRGVVIESKSAIKIIPQHDSNETLFYVDPPYPLSTRNCRHVYQHEMTDEQHRELAALLHGVKGMVLISGYDCSLYDEIYSDWKCDSISALADGASPRTEKLWMNQSLCMTLEPDLLQGAA